MLLRIIYTAVCLTLVFGGYSVICGFITTKYGKYGYYANFLYWLFSVIGSLLSPYLSYYLLGVKWSLVLGAITYAIYIFGYNLDALYWILIVSALNGLGAGLFRTNMNVWLVSQLSTESPSNILGVQKTSDTQPKTTPEFYIGLYNSIFGTSTIFGAILGIFIYNLDLSLYWFLFSVTTIAVILLCFILPAKIDETHQISLGVYKELLLEFKYLYPLIAYQGFSTIYVNSIMSLNFGGNIQLIMIHFLIFSIGYCLASHTLGWLAMELKFVIVFNMLMCLVSSVFVFVSKYFIEIHSAGHQLIYLTYYIPSLMMGFAEASLIYFFIVLFNNEYPDNKASVFAYHRMCYSLSAGLFQLFASVVNLYVLLMCLNILLMIGVGVYMLRIK